MIQKNNIVEVFNEKKNINGEKLINYPLRDKEQIYKQN